MTRPQVRTVAGMLALAGAAAIAVVLLAASPTPNVTNLAGPSSAAWTEAKWPFPIDQWGTGRAFTCKGAGCGREVTLYLRAKLGFCNWTTGVADDEELERVSALDLAGTQRAAVGDGQPI